MRNLILALALLVVGMNGAHAAETAGNNFTMLDSGGGVIGGTNDVRFDWDGTLITSVASAASNATLSSDEPFFGLPWVAHDVTIYGPGTYTIYTDCAAGDAGCGVGASYTVTVGLGQTMAHILIDWGGNLDIDVINVHQSGVFGPSPFYTGPDDGITNTGGVLDGAPNTGSEVWELMSTDVDGDGVNGIGMIDGPFTGINPNYNLILGPISPGITVSIDVTGGTLQECAETGGSTVNISAEAILFGGAELNSFEWTVDGSSAGSGSTITPFLELGGHTVEVLATTTTGESDTDSVAVNVVDTTPPVVAPLFLDNRTGEPISSISDNGAHFVTMDFNATDVCDDATQTQGVVTPTFGVSDGDTLKIQGNNAVNLPTTALELSVTATDASGNIDNGQAILLISD